MSGQHQAKDAYVSQVRPQDVTAFVSMYGAPPRPNRAAYNATQVRHPSSTPGKFIMICQDMPMAPAVYGFADKAAADQWFELAFDTPV